MVEHMATAFNTAVSGTGLVYLLSGLAVGSFSSVLYHRLPRRQSILWPRSRCTSCSHTLGPLELFPVLSFLWLRGHCRHCETKIPWRYPLLELGSGVLALVAGSLGGVWAAAIVLVLLVAVIVFTTKASPEAALRRKEDGVTLVETVVACLLLSIVVLPLLNAVMISRHADLAAQRGTLGVALARGRLNELTSIAREAGGVAGLDAASLAGTTTVTVDTGNGRSDKFTIRTTFSSYPQAPAAANPELRLVQVIVACSTCTGRFGQPVRDVNLTSVLRGRLNGE